MLLLLLLVFTCRLGLPLFCDGFCLNRRHIRSPFLSRVLVSVLCSPHGLRDADIDRNSTAFPSALTLVI